MRCSHEKPRCVDFSAKSCRFPHFLTFEAVIPCKSIAAPGDFSEGSGIKQPERALINTGTTFYCRWCGNVQFFLIFSTLRAIFRLGRIATSGISHGTAAAIKKHVVRNMLFHTNIPLRTEPPALRADADYRYSSPSASTAALPPTRMQTSPSGSPAPSLRSSARMTDGRPMASPWIYMQSASSPSRPFLYR